MDLAEVLHHSGLTILDDHFRSKAVPLYTLGHGTFSIRPMPLDLRSTMQGTCLPPHTCLAPHQHTMCTSQCTSAQHSPTSCISSTAPYSYNSVASHNHNTPTASELSRKSDYISSATKAATSSPINSSTMYPGMASCVEYTGLGGGTANSSSSDSSDSSASITFSRRS